MANDLLSQGIRNFENDGEALKKIVADKLQELYGPKEEVQPA